MTAVVLLALAVIWAAVLLPPYLQKRRATHPNSSVVDFHQQLAVLQRTGAALHGAPLRAGYAPRAVGAPSLAPRVGQLPPASGLGTVAPARPPARNDDLMHRRKDLFLTMVFVAAVTFVLAIVVGGAFWLLHLLADAVTLGYVALLLNAQQTTMAPRMAQPDWYDQWDPSQDYHPEMFTEADPYDPYAATHGYDDYGHLDHYVEYHDDWDMSPTYGVADVHYLPQQRQAPAPQVPQLRPALRRAL